jgi:hypothetical protein
MKSRADVCRQKADDCEGAAARVTDPHIQARYREMSRQWHAMANRQQAIDEALKVLFEAARTGDFCV